jgi:hypothetical protein
LPGPPLLRASQGTAGPAGTAAGTRIMMWMWILADPERVTVMPAQGKAVKITVIRAAMSSVKVAAQGFPKELIIKAKAMHEGKAMQVEISQ